MVVSSSRGVSRDGEGGYHRHMGPEHSRLVQISIPYVSRWQLLRHALPHRGEPDAVRYQCQKTCQHSKLCSREYMKRYERVKIVYKQKEKKKRKQDGIIYVHEVKLDDVIERPCPEEERSEETKPSQILHVITGTSKNMSDL